jgi:hypothetical protein
MNAALARVRGNRGCLWAERAEGAFAVAAGVACASAPFYLLVANDFRMSYVSGIWTALAVRNRTRSCLGTWSNQRCSKSAPNRTLGCAMTMAVILGVGVVASIAG